MLLMRNNTVLHSNTELRNIREVPFYRKEKKSRSKRTFPLVWVVPVLL